MATWAAFFFCSRVKWKVFILGVRGILDVFLIHSPYLPWLPGVSHFNERCKYTSPMDGMGSLMFHFVFTFEVRDISGISGGVLITKLFYGQEGARFISVVCCSSCKICCSSDDTRKVGIKSVVSKDVSFYPENDWNDPIWLILFNWIETT